MSSIQGGLKRTRDNAILREKMMGLPEKEIKSALRSLNKPEKKTWKEMELNEEID